MNEISKAKKNKRIFKKASGSRKLSRRKKNELWAYLFIAPQIIGMLCFVMVPVGVSFVFCFTEWDLITEPVFVGLKNFKAVFSQPMLSISLLNTVLFSIGIIPITMVIALGLALLVNKKLMGLSFYKASFFLPMTTASVAITLVWYWIFAPHIGIINYLLGLVGIDGPMWLIDKTGSRFAIIIMSVWQNMGYYFLIFSAGLKGIAKTYYEAADIDGASGACKLFYITLPLISPTTFFVLITMTINILRLFQEPSILTQGGPEYATYSMVMYIYDLGFRFFRMGEASVVTVVLFIIIIMVTFIQFKFSGRWVFSDEE